MHTERTITCPHCAKSLGGTAREGGFKLRLGITLVDDDGSVHGPCPHCKADVIVATGAALAKSLVATPVVKREPVLVIRRPRESG